MDRRVNILGVGVSAVTMAHTLEVIDLWIRDRDSHYVCLAPAHAIMGCYRDKTLRRIYNCSGLTTPDGMAIVWLSRWYGHRSVERVYGPDLMLAACGRFLDKGYRHYFYGGAPDVTERLVQQLRARFTGLHVVGMESPPFRTLTSKEDNAIAARIQAAEPDIVWVGIGSPRQEIWMSEHLKRLDVPVLIGVGAAFDFLSGNKVQAPRWVQRSGFEWLFRLLTEPRRLWRRYIQYPGFVLLALMQKQGMRSFPLEDH